jgi:hypothetical protein
MHMLDRILSCFTQPWSAARRLVVLPRLRSGAEREPALARELVSISGPAVPAHPPRKRTASGNGRQVALAPPFPLMPRFPLTALGEAEAKVIRERWQAGGSYSVSDTVRARMTRGYHAWRLRAEGVLSTRGPELAHKVEGWRRWMIEHEAYARWELHPKGMAPQNPGPIPLEFAAQVHDGDPLRAPPPETLRKILIYNVKMPDGARYSFRDDPVQLDDKYLLHETGIARFGVRASKRVDIDELLTEAGITDVTERKVMRKLLEVENGFEAVHTYNTDYVSAGFIPFSSGEAGEGMLSRLLRNMKNAHPSEFEAFFRSLGLDVDTRGLVAVHLDSGKVLRGREAVRAVIDDKRLTAVFQRAGERSRAYQVGQLKLAMELYYLASQDFTLRTTLRLGDKGLLITVSGQYGDVLRSEAGKVAIMDRAVHRGVGNARQTFKEACIAVIHEKGAATVEALAGYESLITPVIQVPDPGRIRVMASKELSQPPVVSTP